MSGQPTKTLQDVKNFRKAYMANLNLRMELDDINLQANQLYKRTGTLPQEVEDTRTTEEKLADILALRVEARTLLADIADAQNANKIAQDMTSQQVSFYVQNYEPINKMIKEQYSKGIKAEIFQVLIEQLIYQRQRKLNIDRGTVLNNSDIVEIGDDDDDDDDDADSAIVSASFNSPISRTPGTIIPSTQNRFTSPQEQKEDDESVNRNVLIQELENITSSTLGAKYTRSLLERLRKISTDIPDLVIPTQDNLSTAKERKNWLLRNASGIVPILRESTRAATLVPQNLTSLLDIAQEPPQSPQIGSGIRPKLKKFMKGRGLNKNDIDYESGIQAAKRFSPFGRYVINKNQLINNDIVSISRPSGNRIKEFPSRRVGQKLGKVFKSIVGKGTVSFEDLDNLNDEERTYLHGIAKASHLLDKIDIPPPKRTKTDELINKYEIMKGQILAGQDNKEVIKEFKESILRLSELKLMPKSQVREILMDLTSMGY